MDHYKDHPGRKLGTKYKSRKAEKLISSDLAGFRKKTIWPVDQKDGGCDCDPPCEQGQPWKKQMIQLL